MALTGVLRPGHVQLRVLDLAAALTHYRDVIGLIETGRDAQGRIYLKAWDEHDHHSVGSGSLFARGAMKKLFRRGMTGEEALRVAVEALWDAADDDSATGGPDLGRRIWPTVARIDTDGVRFVEDDAVAAVVDAIVASRSGNPGGAR